MLYYNLRIVMIKFNVIFRGLISSAGEERADFAAIDQTYFCGVCYERFPLSS